MAHRAGIIRYDALEERDRDSLGNFLSEQAFFLGPLSKKIADQWAKTYLSAFGRSAFFSSQRVTKVFAELVDIFIGCLQEQRLDLYFESLKERGVTFSRLGVPFDEVLISLHIFEEICLNEFLGSETARQRLPEILNAMSELHHQGLAILASSYFETTKQAMQTITEDFVEENENLKKEISEIRDSVFAQTAKELGSMQLLISGINRKLRQRVYQLSHVQKIAETLDGESHLPKLLKIASSQTLALCPQNSNLYFGFFDEARKTVNLYHQELPAQPQCSLIKTFYFSEITEAFQAALYDESRKHAHFKTLESIPPALSDIPSVRNQKDFLMIPVRKYREVIGFIFLGVSAENYFSKNTYKFYQRVGLVISKAISSAILFSKSKQRNQFEFILDELTRQEPQKKPMEATLDFCLGSLIDLLGVERSSLMRYNEERKELKVYAAKGYKVYPISGAPIRWGEGIAGLALKDSKIISISKMRDVISSELSNSIFRWHAEAPEIKVKSLLCIPLKKNNKPFGVVNLSTINYYQHFDQSDIEMAHHVIRRMTGLLNDLTEIEAGETAG